MLSIGPHGANKKLWPRPGFFRETGSSFFFEVSPLYLSNVDSLLQLIAITKTDLQFIWPRKSIEENLV